MYRMTSTGGFAGNRVVHNHHAPRRHKSKLPQVLGAQHFNTSASALRCDEPRFSPALTRHATLIRVSPSAPSFIVQNSNWSSMAFGRLLGTRPSLASQPRTDLLRKSPRKSLRGIDRGEAEPVQKADPLRRKTFALCVDMV